MNDQIENSNNDQNKNSSDDLFSNSMKVVNKECENILNSFYNNLDTLSKITIGDKLYIKDGNINIDDPFMFQGIWRYCYNVSRKDAIHIINKILNDIEIFFNAILLKNIDNKTGIKKRFSSLENDAFNTIITKLNSSIYGINNLKKTYEKDNQICDELEKINNKIHNLIDNFTNMLF